MKSSESKHWHWGASFFVLAAASLYLQAFLLPGTPIYQGDSSPIFLLDAMRMLHGEIIYKNFFELTLPGAPAIYFLLLKWFGIHMWIPSAVFVALGVALAFLGWKISSALFEQPLAHLASLLFLAFAFSTERDPTHHWFSGLAVLGALAFVARGWAPKRMIGAGACLGLATLFTQSTGVLAVLGFVAYFAWDGRNHASVARKTLENLGELAAGFALITLPAAVWLIHSAGFARLLYCTLLFPLKYFHLWFWNTPRAMTAEIPSRRAFLEVPALVIWASMYAVVGFAYVAWPAQICLEKGKAWAEGERYVALLGFVGFFELVSVLFSPSWLRVSSISLPALVILVWRVRQSRFAGVAIGFLTLAAAAMLVARPAIVQTSSQGTLQFPAGRAALLSRSRFEKLRWLLARTAPGDFIFQASDCDLYFPLELRDPAPVPFVTASGYSRPAQIRATARALRTRKIQYVLWSVWLDVPRHRADPHFDAAVLAPLRDALRKRYHLVRSFGPPDYDQVWKLNGSGAAAPHARR